MKIKSMGCIKDKGFRFSVENDSLGLGSSISSEFHRDEEELKENKSLAPEPIEEQVESQSSRSRNEADDE